MSPISLIILLHRKMISTRTVLVRATVGYEQSGDKVNLFLVLSCKIIFKVISVSTSAPTHSHFIPLFFPVSAPFPSSSLLVLLSQFMFSSWIIPQLNLNQSSAALRCYTHTKMVGLPLTHMILFYLKQQFTTMRWKDYKYEHWIMFSF